MVRRLPPESDPMNGENVVPLRPETTTPDAVVPLEAFESLHQIYGEELAKARMANALLHQQLLDAGIEPVEKSAEDLLELFEGSQRILHEASLFAKKIGTSWELLDESWPRRR